MTTIACDGKTIVSESQATDCNDINHGYQKKIHKVKGVGYFAAASRVDDAILVRNWLENGSIEKDRPDVHDGFSAIVMTYSGKVYMYGAKLIPMPSSPPVFLGSGYELAMGAYEVCGDLVKSVKAAIKFDVNSGGKIQCSSLIDLEVSKNDK